MTNKFFAVGMTSLIVILLTSSTAMASGLRSDGTDKAGVYDGQWVVYKPTEFKVTTDQPYTKNNNKDVIFVFISNLLSFPLGTIHQSAQGYTAAPAVSSPDYLDWVKVVVKNGTDTYGNGLPSFNAMVSVGSNGTEIKNPVPAYNRIMPDLYFRSIDFFPIDNPVRSVSDAGMRQYGGQTFHVYNDTVGTSAQDSSGVMYAVQIKALYDSKTGIALDILVWGSIREPIADYSNGTQYTFHMEAVDYSMKSQPSQPTPLEPPPTSTQSITVAMKNVKTSTILMVRNNGDVPIYGMNLQSDEGNIKFVKAKDWERHRMSAHDVFVNTTDRPITKGHSELILLKLDNMASSLSWNTLTAANTTIAFGTLMPK